MTLILTNVMETDYCSAIMEAVIEQDARPPKQEVGSRDFSMLFGDYADTTYPAINLYLLRDGEPEELVCFAEYNSEHSPCHELCIGVYTSDAEDTQYYGPSRPERETEYGKGD